MPYFWDVILHFRVLCKDMYIPISVLQVPKVASLPPKIKGCNNPYLNPPKKASISLGS